MKALASKQMHNEAILINKSKGSMLREEREIEIERENKVLLQKISSVMSKRSSYSIGRSNNIRTKVNKSLNQFYRKRQMENIEMENKRFVQRLQQKKPTLNMERLQKDWLENKGVIKRMANCQFNLTSIKSSSRVRSITGDRFYKSKYDKVKLSRFKNIAGQNMLIKVEFIGEVLRITGDSQSSKDIKVIEIPRDEAILYIEKDCHGKMENIFDKLEYDSTTETLFLVSEHLEEEGDMDFSEFNPEIDRVVGQKRKDERRNKSSIENTKKGTEASQREARKKKDSAESKKSEEKKEKTLETSEKKL
jgi:hypothetical protein